MIYDFTQIKGLDVSLDDFYIDCKINNKDVSKEEVHFTWYLKELQQENIISDIIYQPYSFILSEAVKMELEYIKEYKTKKAETKKKEYTFIKPHLYTADFCWKWDKSMRNLFFGVIGDKNSNLKNSHFIAHEFKGNFYTIVDVKGKQSKFNSHRYFAIDQKWAYDKYKVYVQKIVSVDDNKDKHKGLFHNTFTPERFLRQDKAIGQRKIHFNIRTLSDFIIYNLI